MTVRPRVALLSETLAEILGSTLPHNVAPTGISCDSRRVAPGDLYVALPGRRTHGISFEGEAARRGAVGMVSDRPGSVLRTVVVSDPREVLGPLAAAIQGWPSEHMDVVGITGTNGKTTTAFVTQHLLNHSRGRAGRITTIDTAWDGAVTPSIRTTPEAPDLQAALARMVAAGCDAAVIEVSSHGLAQSRVNGVHFAVGAFTNLGRDHLDFHGNRDAYLKCKASLFRCEQCRSGVINVDDAAGRQVADMATCPVVTVSAHGSPEGEWRVTAAEFAPRSTSFEVTGPCGSFGAVTPLAGRHNLANTLTALAICHQLGVDVVLAATTLGAFPGVPGRLEEVETGQPFAALVDFAHNPEALTAALGAVRARADGRVIVVIGATGDRDRAKRPLMRQAAAAGAEVVIVTTDDPYDEDPATIISDVMRGAEAAHECASFIVEPDRARAILRAVRIAREGDAILVTGRGHETVQTVGTREIPFDDRLQLREAVAQEYGSRPKSAWRRPDG